jgi:hypothetical protein
MLSFLPIVVVSCASHSLLKHKLTLLEKHGIKSVPQVWKIFGLLYAVEYFGSLLTVAFATVYGLIGLSTLLFSTAVFGLLGLMCNIVLSLVYILAALCVVAAPFLLSSDQAYACSRKMLGELQVLGKAVVSKVAKRLGVAKTPSDVLATFQTKMQEMSATTTSCCTCFLLRIQECPCVSSLLHKVQEVKSMNKEELKKSVVGASKSFGKKALEQGKILLNKAKETAPVLKQNLMETFAAVKSFLKSEGLKGVEKYVFEKRMERIAMRTQVLKEKCETEMKMATEADESGDKDRAVVLQNRASDSALQLETMPKVEKFAEIVAEASVAAVPVSVSSDLARARKAALNANKKNSNKQQESAFDKVSAKIMELHQILLTGQSPVPVLLRSAFLLLKIAIDILGSKFSELVLKFSEAVRSLAERIENGTSSCQEFCPCPPPCECDPCACNFVKQEVLEKWGLLTEKVLESCSAVSSTPTTSDELEEQIVSPTEKLLSTEGAETPLTRSQSEEDFSATPRNAVYERSSSVPHLPEQTSGMTTCEDERTTVVQSMVAEEPEEDSNIDIRKPWHLMNVEEEEEEHEEGSASPEAPPAKVFQ